MSATNFYLEKGFTPTWKTVSFGGAGTITVWTPRTSTRIVLTQLVVASNLGGSSAFYFGNLAGDKIVQFNHAASSVISTELHADSGTMDRTLVGNVSAAGTDGVKVSAFGFELPA